MKKIFGFILLLVAPAFSQQSSGPNFVSSGSSVNTGGTAWTSPGNITADDGVTAVASSVPAGTTTSILRGTGLGFSIPGGALINGIQAQVKKFRSGTASCNDGTIRITRGGGESGNNNANATAWPLGSGASAYTTYGSSSDLWGLVWAASQINDSSFGIDVQATNTSGSGTVNPNVDAIKVTVFFTPVSSNMLLMFSQTCDFHGCSTTAIPGRSIWSTLGEFNPRFFKIALSAHVF